MQTNWFKLLPLLHPSCMHATVNHVTELQHGCALQAWLLSTRSWYTFPTWTPSQHNRWACVCVQISHVDWLDFWTSVSFQMVSLMGTDGHKVYEAVSYGFHIITAPVVFLYCIVSCCFILKSAILEAVITMCMFLITCPLLVSFSTAIYLCLNEIFFFLRISVEHRWNNFKPFI
jgi:hypothetical protein